MTAINPADILSVLRESPAQPPLYAPGESLFWDDPHISRGMLECHLNPENDLASRRAATIEREIDHLTGEVGLKAGDRIMDLGCGPGLYSLRLAEKGLRVTGLDISRNSLEYAREQAVRKGLEITYRRLNFFDLDYDAEFDAILQVNGELNTFSDAQRDALLALLRRALKPGGRLIFDVTTRETRLKYGLASGWSYARGGFWRAGEHLVLEQGIDYPEENVWLDRYFVIDRQAITVYHNWFHDYDRPTITRVLTEAGFEVTRVWNDLSGTPFAEGGEWIALEARRQD